VELLVDLRGYVVKTSRYSKYTPLFKNYVEFMETADQRIFLMKDMAAIRNAVRLGADPHHGDHASMVFN
jgi:hypothetical protein